MTSPRRDELWEALFRLDLVLRREVPNWGHWRKRALDQIKRQLNLPVMRQTARSRINAGNTLRGELRRRLWLEIGLGHPERS